MNEIAEGCATGTTFEEKYIDLSENVTLRTITYTPAVKNDHPTIVFVPGWVTQLSAWLKVLRAMTEEFPVIYVETRDKSSSKIAKNAGYSVEDLGQDILEIISHFNLQDKKYLLLGSSLGATVIIDRCRFLENIPLCLVLINPNAVFKVPRFAMVIIRLFYPGFYVLLKPVVKWYLKNFRLDIKSDYAQYQKYCNALDSADPWKLKKAVIPFSKYEVWDLLNNIHIPSLIIGASKDKLHEPENLKKMVTMLKESTLIDMETNDLTHSEGLITEIYRYLIKLPDFNCSCQTCKNLIENGILE